MKERNYPRTMDEHAKEADRIFLEFAIKKCSLTLSEEEILSQTKRLLSEMSDEKSKTITEEYPEIEKDARISASAADAEDKGEASGKRYAESNTENNASGNRYAESQAKNEISGKRYAKSNTTSAQKDKAALKKQRKKKKSLWGDLLFYGVLIALIIGVAVIANGSSQGPRSVAGFTAQTVLTSSMESVIPKGSLVISLSTDPDTLQIGDDITFMTNETTTVTHRIIGIIENYADTGQRAFQTQGVMNDSPDSQPVPAVNVVGKVVFHSLTAGKIAAFLESYWPLLLFFIVILAVLTRVLKYIYGKDGKKDKDKDKKRKAKNPEVRSASFF